jgi:hypothetical protein
MALNIGLEASFDNVQDRKGIRKKAGKVNGTEVDVTITSVSVEF